MISETSPGSLAYGPQPHVTFTRVNPLPGTMENPTLLGEAWVRSTMRCREGDLSATYSAGFTYMSLTIATAIGITTTG